jgi:hypothetical protein
MRLLRDGVVALDQLIAIFIIYNNVLEENDVRGARAPGRNSTCRDTACGKMSSKTCRPFLPV